MKVTFAGIPFLLPSALLVLLLQAGCGDSYVEHENPEADFSAALKNDIVAALRDAREDTEMDLSEVFEGIDTSTAGQYQDTIDKIAAGMDELQSLTGAERNAKIDELLKEAESLPGELLEIEDDAADADEDE